MAHLSFKYNLVILTGVPRISFDMWMIFYIQLVKCDDHCKDLLFMMYLLLNTFKNTAIDYLKHK